MTDPVVLLSTGDVVGPTSSTAGSMVLFDGTSGKKIKGNNAVVTTQGLALLDDVDAEANRATIGLNLVNNTSDLNKPVSTAQETALNTKANKIDVLPNLIPQTGNNYTLLGSQYVFASATMAAHMCQNAVYNGTWTRQDVSKPGIVVLAKNGQLLVQPFAAGDNPLVFTNTYPVINSSNIATEAAAGVIPIAAQTLVDAGSDDSAAVTPKKLRWGVSMSLGPTGHLALPSWLGGVIFNWGRTNISFNGQRIVFSKPYPTEVFIFLSGTGIDNSGQAEVMNPAQNTLNLTGVNVNATQADEYPWLSIGR